MAGGVDSQSQSHGAALFSRVPSIMGDLGRSDGVKLGNSPYST
jgi:hypothetical protein